MSDKYNKEEPSVLQKIQNKTGCLFLVIGIAMLAFVLTDLTSSNGVLFGSNDRNSVGTIAGESINSQEFDALYQQLKQNAIQNNPGIQITEMMDEQYKQQAWNSLVDERVKQKEFKKLGIDISTAELMDLTIGANTHPTIVQAFTDPETKQFNKDRLIQFLQEDVNVNPDQQESWNEFQKSFVKQLVDERYNFMVESSFYTTELEVRAAHAMESGSRNASIVNVPYASISDSLVSITDADIKAYLSKHKGEFKQEASRDIEFVSFDVIPSKEDSAKLRNEIAELAAEFRDKPVEDAGTFVMVKSSEMPFDSAYKTPGTFAPEVEPQIFSANKGDLVGPFYKDGVYSMFRITDVGEDSLPSVRASHILIRITQGDTAAAVASAREVLGKIRRGETTFEQEAAQNIDGTGNKGGDLGYIREGNYMVPEKLFNRLKTSGLNNYVIVTTNNGVHIAKATSAVTKKTVQVAAYVETLTASTQTDQEYYQQAGRFQTSLGGDKSFEEVAEDMGLIKRIAVSINEEDRRVSGINNGNIVAKWLFNAETDEDDVSDIMTIDNKYIIARCTKIREEGMPKVDDVRDEVETLVKDAKRAEMILPKVKEALEQTKDKNELAKQLETIVSEAPVANFVSANLPYIGQDKKIMGAIFGVEVGSNSDAVVGEKGVAVVFVNGLNQEENSVDIETKKIEMNSNVVQSSRTALNEALMEKADVKDRRYRIYN